MRLIERTFGAITKGNRKETAPNPQTLLEFSTLLRQERAGVVCVFPYKNLKTTKDQGSIFEYGLDYISESITGKPLIFQEKFGKPLPDQNNDLRNKITAISRIELLEQLAQVNGYVVTKPEYLAEPIDPTIYPAILLDAKEKGIKPFPLPIPEAFKVINN